MTDPPDPLEPHDHAPYARLLRRATEHLHTDTAELLGRARAAGGRIRRRERWAAAGAGLAGAGCVAAVVAVTVLATRPVPAPAPVVGGGSTSGLVSDSVSDPAPDRAHVPPRRGDRGARPSRAEVAPFRIGLAGWTCSETLDEKQTCSHGVDAVELLWRPASDHGAWTSDPDKTAAYVSRVHGDAFAVVDPTAPTPAATAVAVGRSLRWTS